MNKKSPGKNPSSFRPSTKYPAPFQLEEPAFTAAVQPRESSHADYLITVADFSNGGVNPGAEIDLAGPGVDILSTVPGGYGKKSGTSMATPCIAGLAALHAETTGKRGRELWAVLVGTAQRLPLSAQDAGSGLGQAA